MQGKLRKYQRKHANRFKQAEQLSAEDCQALNWAIGLSGEIGEVDGLLKDKIFGQIPDNYQMELAKELGDVFWYLNAIATSQGLDMEHILELNDAKLAHRHDDNKQFSYKSKAEKRSNDFEDTCLYQVLESKILGKQMPMNVIMCGPDGSGKSTMSSLIAERLEFGLQSCSFREQNKLDRIVELLENQCDMVYDRLYFPDHLVYSEVKQKEMAFSETRYWLEEILPMMHDLNCVLVYVTADIPTLTDRSKVWKDDYVSVNDLHDIKSAYRNLFTQLEERKIMLPTIYVDTTDLELNSIEYARTLSTVVESIQDFSFGNRQAGCMERVMTYEGNRTF